MAKRPKGASHVRRAIAAQAARLIAEDGLADFGAAKRKAARHLGYAQSDGLPDNQEIEQELRAYQALYQNHEQRQRLLDMRRVAVEIMGGLTAYKPYLAGGVWNGTASRASAIDIDLFTDELKSLELLLLNRDVTYSTGERPHFIKALQARIPVLEFDLHDYRARLSVFAETDARHALKAGAAGQVERGTADQVRALVQSAENETTLQGFLAAIR